VTAGVDGQQQLRLAELAHLSRDLLGGDQGQVRAVVGHVDALLEEHLHSRQAAEPVLQVPGLAVRVVALGDLNGAPESEGPDSGLELVKISVVRTGVLGLVDVDVV
jgi:hypothetical protein